MGTENRKISLMKFQRSYFWDDIFLGFSVAVVIVYSVFSVGAAFMEKFAIQNRLTLDFSNNSKKGGLCVDKLAPLDKSTVFFLVPIL